MKGKQKNKFSHILRRLNPAGFNSVGEEFID
jgi:hypothetical protein